LEARRPLLKLWNGTSDTWSETICRTYSDTRMSIRRNDTLSKELNLGMNVPNFFMQWPLSPIEETQSLS
jgi:hypothetical protein